MLFETTLIRQGSIGSLSGGDLGLNSSILGATGLGELTLDTGLFGLKIVLFIKSRGDSAIINTKLFVVRIKVGIG